jgi:hypothetical protein
MDETKAEPGNGESRSLRAIFQPGDVNKAAHDVVDWMLQGASGAQIVEAIAEKYPDADVKVLLQKAGDHFESISRADTSLIRGWCLEATRDLYRRMIEVGDYPNALRAVKQMRDFCK